MSKFTVLNEDKVALLKYLNEYIKEMRELKQSCGLNSDQKIQLRKAKDDLYNLIKAL